MQYTVRLPRWVATSAAILIAAVGVAALLPATASSDSSIVVCVDPTSGDLTVSPSCTGSTLTWSQSGVPGPAGLNGAPGPTGATGEAGPAGPAGPATHLDKTHPALAAQIEASLDVQSSALTDIGAAMRKVGTAAKRVPPSSDPAVSALQTQVTAQGAAITRLANVLRALAKAQTQLVQGLE